MGYTGYKKDTNEFYTDFIVSSFINDYKDSGIKTFGQWLVYFDENFDEINGIVEDYCAKVVDENLIRTIEPWRKTVMLNALALYMIEMDIDQIPTGDMINKILKVFVETIRMYKYKRMGLVKIVGDISISGNNHKYVQ